eukprot:CAMPEP_0175087604 /NCGR_PEP_ID=MMETSP0052_2-20121109/29922_1 /TAXON_ID=51329 ORGANISM="Polytomella parva, Strain SAG 63-3" /NCGR_SAMPLE_ID=MMETSP0052_2 /ASSEMBLY_ACC=CAM_ASM_000194 /LENGTH=565 /DNA_ID=CAMNT_0016359967 /DNA_START=1054 /DNA_END=2751 /DNA_ORIENTATION=+
MNSPSTLRNSDFNSSTEKACSFSSYSTRNSDGQSWGTYGNQHVLGGKNGSGINMMGVVNRRLEKTNNTAESSLSSGFGSHVIMMPSTSAKRSVPGLCGSRRRKSKRDLSLPFDKSCLTSMNYIPGTGSNAQALFSHHSYQHPSYIKDLPINTHMKKSNPTGTVVVRDADVICSASLQIPISSVSNINDITSASSQASIVPPMCPSARASDLMTNTNTSVTASATHSGHVACSDNNLGEVCKEPLVGKSRLKDSKFKSGLNVQASDIQRLSTFLASLPALKTVKVERDIGREGEVGQEEMADELNDVQKEADIVLEKRVNEGEGSLLPLCSRDEERVEGRKEEIVKNKEVNNEAVEKSKKEKIEGKEEACFSDVSPVQSLSVELKVERHNEIMEGEGKGEATAEVNDAGGREKKAEPTSEKKREVEREKETMEESEDSLLILSLSPFPRSSRRSDDCSSFSVASPSVMADAVSSSLASSYSPSSLCDSPSYSVAPKCPLALFDAERQAKARASLLDQNRDFHSDLKLKNGIVEGADKIGFSSKNSLGFDPGLLALDLLIAQSRSRV